MKHPFRDINQLVTECESQLSSGQIDSDEQFLSRFPDIREELRDALRKRRMVAAAIDRADNANDVSTVVGQDTLGCVTAGGAATEVTCPECRQVVPLDNHAVEGGAVEGPVKCSWCHVAFTVVIDANLASQCGRSVGRFQLVSLLGRGGFGAVWRAYDPQLHRYVAIKVPRRGELTEQEAEQFIREARAAAQLSHANIVSVLEVGQADGVPYIACDLIEGETLTELLQQGPLSPSQAARMGQVIAEALETAHAAGVIHRDLKPSNILLGEQIDSGHRIPFVADFGLAKRNTGEVTITADGQLLGTPAYMPPEQASGHSHQADARSDIYSLGALLYHMLTGETCFGGTVQALIYQSLHADPIRPRLLNRNIPVDLETICLKCLEKKPEHRYQTAAELASDLERWQQKQPIHARPLGPFGRLLRFTERKPAIAALSAAVLLVGVAGLSGVTWQWRQTATSLKREKAERIRANESLTRETAERIRADENKTLAWDVVDGFLLDVATVDLPNEPRVGKLRIRLLEQAVAHYDKLVKRNPDDAETRYRAANAHASYGEHLLEQGADDAGAPQLELAFRLLDESAALCDDPLELRKIDIARIQVCLQTAGLFFFSQTDDPQYVIQRLLEAESLASGLIELEPTNLEFLAYQADASAKLGAIYRHRGAAETVSTLNRSIDRWMEITRRQPDSPRPWDFAARCNIDLATYHITQGQAATALEFAERGVRCAEEGLALEPGNRDCRTILILAQTALSKSCQRLGRKKSAQQALHNAIDSRRILCDEFPESEYNFEHLGGLHARLGELYSDDQEYAAAGQQFERAISIHDEIRNRNPANRQSVVYGAYYRALLSRALTALGDSEEAIELAKLAVSQLRDAVYESQILTLMRTKAYEQLARAQVGHAPLEEILRSIDFGQLEVASQGSAFRDGLPGVETSNNLLRAKMDVLVALDQDAAAISACEQELGRIARSMAQKVAIPQSCGILTYLAKLCIREGKFEEATDYLMMAIDAEPSITQGGRSQLSLGATQQTAYAMLAECHLRKSDNESVDDVVNLVLKNFENSLIGQVIAAAILKHCLAMELESIDQPIRDTWQQQFDQLKLSARAQGISEQELNAWLAEPDDDEASPPDA